MPSLRQDFFRANQLVILIVALVTICHHSLPAQGADWIAVAKTYAAAHPENKGLPHLIEALSQIDFKSTPEINATLKSIATDGWTKPYPEINQLLLSKSAALIAATKAADAAPFDLPPMTEVESPVMNYLHVTMIFRLLACEARRLEAAGDINGAAQRAIQAARFSMIPSSKDQAMIGTLLGISGMGIISPSLESILNNPKTSRETLQFIGASLYDIEQKRLPGWSALELEKRMTLEALNRLDGLKKSNPEMAKEIEPFAKHKDVYERIMIAIIENESKSYWQRQPAQMVINSVKGGASVNFPLINSDESATREAVMLARMRLLQARCAERLGMNEAAAKFQDPFTGQPVKFTPQAIYSLGPDKSDQGGGIIYDPTNGTISAGDVVLRK